MALKWDGSSKVRLPLDAMKHAEAGRMTQGYASPFLQVNAKLKIST